jgi:hypothetical protein
MAVAPVSLYLELEEGRAADIEVAGRAAVAFSQTSQLPPPSERNPGDAGDKGDAADSPG